LLSNNTQTKEVTQKLSRTSQLPMKSYLIKTKETCTTNTEKKVLEKVVVVADQVLTYLICSVEEWEVGANKEALKKANQL